MKSKSSPAAKPAPTSAKPAPAKTLTPAEIMAAKKAREKADATKPGHCCKSIWATDLKEIRVNLGLTLDEVAGELGMKTPVLFNLESGHDPRLSQAMLLANFYGVEIEDIWEERIA
jgi:DNA-binding XRE family transcriptional regulator